MSLIPKLAVADNKSRERLVDALLHRAGDKGIEVKADHKAEQQGGGYYDQSDRTVHMALRNSASTLAHELGHAEFDQGVLGRLIQSPTARAMSGIGVTIGAVIALVAEGSLLRRIALSTGAVAAAQLPLLTGEGIAWYKGHKMMKEHGASPEELAHLRSEAVRLGSTYLQPGAMGLGGSMLLASLSHATS